MPDEVTRGMVAEILRLARQRLGRELTADEAARLSRPRSYLALEMIIDTLRDPDADRKRISDYVAKLD